ncbi:YebC/PmpR family DNA-binding transcriptional regulator [Candidatus Rhodoluna planktonica]|uniref:Probable transcriptional regulatory protein A4Z71_03415 n=1 Tax=Candidatus Rhodoluna planktonica TaxID=535712 RepID=A0A1D9DYZ5_9MICO|nr:YebC/PmpR family DNA-binding transcriptional regulator [Candidatus Rhodoluna planktonica]AOY56033.1 transcriptional regulator [Candidatus Rhodoluna planktonica]
MSGHSKWATTKHKKAAIDAKRAKLFAKLIKNIEVAARLGGPDVDGNPTLYDAVQKGRKSSLPNDNIERAIKRGAGVGGDAIEYMNIMYEGYGPNGVAVMIECLTDNKNRAAAEVRLAVGKNHGSMADPGSVSYQFSRKGIIVVPKDGAANEDSILEAVLEVGIEDIEDRGESFVLTTDPSSMVAVRTALQAAGIDYESADVEFVSAMPVQVDAATARKVIQLIDALEDLDDVQNVYSNFDITADVLAELEADD